MYVCGDVAADPELIVNMNALYLPPKRPVQTPGWEKIIIIMCWRMIAKGVDPDIAVVAIVSHSVLGHTRKKRERLQQWQKP